MRGTIKAEQPFRDHFRSRAPRTLEEQRVQNAARVNGDRVRKPESHALAARRDELGFVNEVAGRGRLEQERMALKNSVREPASARLLPSLLFFENLDADFRVAGCEPRRSDRSGWSTPDNRNALHLRIHSGPTVFQNNKCREPIPTPDRLQSGGEHGAGTIFNPLSGS